MIETRKIAPPRAGIRTCYQVYINGKLYGHVWSTIGWSYWGTEGWNRGLRIRDFHPVEWHCWDGDIPSGCSYLCVSKKTGIESLVGKFKETR